MSQNDAGSQDVRTALDNYSRGIPRLGQGRTDAVTTAVTSKLVRQRGRNASPFAGNRRSLDADNASLFNRIADETTNAIISARNAMQLLPDIEIAMNLLIAAILSPKDMNTIELSYSTRDKVLAATTTQKMIEVLKDHFETHHNLKQQLAPALKDILADTGSYPVLVLAENTIDRLINGNSEISLENLKETTFDPTTQKFLPLGFLGNPPTPEEALKPFDEFGLESLISHTVPQASYDAKAKYLPRLKITDNPGVLRLEKMRDRLRADRTAKLMATSGIRPSFETHNDAGQLIHTAYRDPSYQISRQIAVPTTGAATKRATIGHPLVMKLPSESVIPVHEPGNPMKHLGYFILLEESGGPIHRAFEQDYYKNMSKNQSGTLNSDFSKSLLRDAKLISLGNGMTDTTMTFKQLGDLYGDLLEHELNSRLQRGVYGAGATVARPEEIYRIMFGRAMAGRGTQLLYVPEEMLIYMAFDYNQYGIGQSLVQRSIILAGQRANLSVATVLAEMKNAVARTTLGITLDPDDDDPGGTVEHLVNEQQKLRSSYPMYVAPPMDVVDIIQNASMDIEVSGNTGYPETKVQVTESNSNRTIPNVEFQKDLRSRHILSFGIPPELVDATQSPEFATSIVTNNLMLIKTVMQRQEEFMPFWEKYVRIYTISSGTLMEELREVVRTATRKPDSADLETSEQTAKDQVAGSDGGDVDRIVLDFLTQLVIRLPKPEGAKTANIKKAFDDYLEFLDVALPMFISADTIGGELAGEIGTNVEAVQKAYRALFVRRWLRENNAAPELEEMLELGENDSPGLDLMAEIEAHNSPIMINIRDFLVKMKRRSAADNAVLDTATEQTGAAGGMGGGGGGDMGGDDGMGGGGGDGSGDGGDMSLDIDVSAGDGGAAAEGGAAEPAAAEEEETEASSSETATDADGNVTKTESSSSSSSSAT